ncbi:nucleoside-diphosphate-sugar epimerase [Oleiphilus messinensis]|uniref:Nucleoside-diphosphate-sugar epimerase n=1 Tax=Oleiphilus messinensis TaxID=141451 RepID=A0A1Y0I7R9_9GAMM|nr:NAD(P)H-binding protein [Oleiphilus messinensis]ARU56270.1 nucleoside-diphosphate-sugar epimerase [Oleiphilus messinensis]
MVQNNSEMKSQRTALVLGSTGLVGSELIRGVLASGLYDRVITYGRRKPAIAHSKLQSILGNLEEFAQKTDALSFDDVYCCLGSTIKKAGSEDAFRHVDFDWPVQIASLLCEKGLRHFVIISALGANADSALFYPRIKGETEDALKRLPIPYLTILRPSLLVGDRKETRFMEGVSAKLMGIVKPVLIGRLTNLLPVSAEKVAEAMVQAGRECASESRNAQLLVLDSATIQRY